jgi:hypothetical protein
MNSLDIERYNSNIQFYFNYAEIFLSWISTFISGTQIMATFLAEVLCYQLTDCRDLPQQQLGKKEWQLMIEHSRESRKAGQSTRKYY